MSGKQRCPKGKIRAPSGRCIEIDGNAHRKYIRDGKMPLHRSSTAKSPKQKTKQKTKQKDVRVDDECPKGKIRAPSGRCIEIGGSTHLKYIKSKEMEDIISDDIKTKYSEEELFDIPEKLVETETKLNKSDVEEILSDLLSQIFELPTDVVTKIFDNMDPDNTIKLGRYVNQIFTDQYLKYHDLWD